MYKHRLVTETVRHAHWSHRVSHGTARTFCCVADGAERAGGEKPSGLFSYSCLRCSWREGGELVSKHRGQGKPTAFPTRRGRFLFFTPKEMKENVSGDPGTAGERGAGGCANQHWFLGHKTPPSKAPLWPAPPP